MSIRREGQGGPRRVAVGLAAYLAFWAVLAWPGVAAAYVDPGSGSAIVTAILGAVGAVGYMLRKFFYRVIKKAFRREKPDGAEQG